MNITWRLVIFAIAACLGATAGAFSTPAYAEGELVVSASSVSVGEANELQLLAKVLDRNGRPVTGLKADSFAIKVDGREYKAASVQSVVDAQVAISSLLVIDTSGSMVGSPIIDARQAASQYVGSQATVDSVAVIAFADGVQSVTDYSHDFNAVQGSLGGLTARGNTALFEAVVRAAQSISAREDARRVVILLSDGENFGPSTTARGQAIDAARTSGVTFYIIGLGPTIDRQFLQELSDATQGAMYLAPSSAQLADLFEDIGEVLRSEYLVNISLEGSGLEGETQATFAVRSDLGTGETPVKLQLPVVQVPATPAPTTNQPVSVASGEDSNFLLWVLVLLLAVVFLAGAASYLKHWNDQRVPGYKPPVRDVGAPVNHDENTVSTRDSPPALLRLSSGEEHVFTGLATLGVDSDCTFRLPISTAEFGHGEVRIWFANQRYLIHDVSPRSRVRVNGKAVAWSILGDGDEIEIRGVKLRFFSESPAPAPRY